MPPVGDLEELERYKAVLEEASRFSGFFMWKPIAAEWVREHLDHYTTRAVELLVCKHRDKIRQKEEKRPEFCVVYQFYYSVTIAIDGMDVFIESVFEPGSSSDPDTIRVVSIHPITK